MRFFLGTHQVCWLQRLAVPLFVSRHRLEGRKRFPRARCEWALDSGGFTELDKNGGWSINATAYAAEVQRYADAIGNLAWVAPQDWMCEPDMLGKTGLTIAEHQRRTTDNFLELRTLVREPPVIPVLQGWHLEDYLAHMDQYADAGVSLQNELLVGVGTMCRRQGEQEAISIISRLWSEGLRLHAFGFKVKGLRAAAPLLASADSLAWSQNARHNPPMEGCQHAKCTSCVRWALAWRERLLARLPTEAQLSLF